MAIIKALTILMRVDNRKLKGGFRQSKQITENAAKDMAMNIKDVLVAAGIGAAVAGSIRRALKIEKFEIQFAGLTGNNQLAADAMKQMRELSRNSPFDEERLFKGGAKLLAFGVGVSELTDTMKFLGDAAAATGSNIDEIAVVYGQVLAKGRFQGEEALQFAERGISLYDELEKILGKNRQQILAMQEAGQIGPEIMTQAFRNLTSEGGAFENMMGKMSNTTGAKLKNLKDSVLLLAEKFGKALFPAVQMLSAVFTEMANDSGSSLNRTLRFIAGTTNLIASLIGKVIQLIVWLDKVTNGWLGTVLVGAAAFVTLLSAFVAGFVVVKTLVLLWGALNAALAFTGAMAGPIGWALLAGAAAAATGVAMLMGSLVDDIDFGAAYDTVENLDGMIGKARKDAKMLKESMAGGAMGPGGLLNTDLAEGGSQEAFKIMYGIKEGRQREVELLEKIEANTRGEPGSGGMRVGPVTRTVGLVDWKG